MPNRTGASLKRGTSRRRGKAQEVAVDESTETTYTSEDSKATDTNDNPKDENMSDEKWDYEQGEGGVDTLEREDENTEQGDDASLPDFAAQVEDAPADYTPQRASAGRKREPSPFDEIVVKAKGQGWKRVPYEGEDQVKAIKRQLQKAQHYHDLGMDMNITATHVEFNVREKQPRSKKETTGTNGQTALDLAGGEQDANDKDE